MDINAQALVIVAEILEELAPADTPEEYERLAGATVSNINNFDGGPELARAVAAELRRRALVMRNVAKPD